MISWDKDTLGDVLANLDIYAPGLSYQETADLIIRAMYAPTITGLPRPVCPTGKERHTMNDLQRNALTALAEHYDVEINDDNFKPAFDLPDGYVAGWVGPIYVGVSPDGRISS